MIASDALSRYTDQLAPLSAYDGAPEAFWSAYLAAVGGVLAPRRLLLLVSTPDQGWQAIAQWPETAPDQAIDADVAMQLIPLAQAKEIALARDAKGGVIGLALDLPDAPVPRRQKAVLVALLDAGRDHGDSETLLLSWAALVAQIPAHYSQRRLLAAQPQVEPQGAEKAERLHDLVQLAIQLGQESRFMRMAFVLCNELAARYQCDRVSLGWVKGPYVALVAVSHTEKFDPRSSASRALEALMEEALEQEAVLAYPAPEGGRLITRAHQKHADQMGHPFLLTLPVSRADQAEAVVTLERQGQALSAAQTWEIQLLLALVARGLVDLHQSERWWGDRLAQDIRHWAQDLLGPRHTWWKLLGAGALSFFLASLVLPWSYRVDAGLAIRSKDLLFMPAPFDGYLRSVHVNVGDRVEAGAVLVELDTRDLLLEASMAQSELQRAARETEKAQGARQLADMQISYARQQQAEARLNLIRHQLENAQVRAPFSGIVTEGDLKKNLGAPLRKGDLLVKLAQAEESFIEIEIDQADVHLVQVGTRGEFALVGRPDQKFDLVIDRVDPASVSREGRTVYLARAQAQGPAQTWWRPGMGGTAKLDAGDRSLLWVMTHRTVRFLREFFWV